MSPSAALRHHDPRQDELPLSTLGSLHSHKVFPGRTTICVAEVAEALSCDTRHILRLIEEFELTGGRSGLKGFDISRRYAPAAPGTPSCEILTRVRAIQRSCWRVAVSDFDAYLAKHRESHGPELAAVSQLSTINSQLSS